MNESVNESAVTTCTTHLCSGATRRVLRPAAGECGGGAASARRDARRRPAADLGERERAVAVDVARAKLVADPLELGPLDELYELYRALTIDELL